MVVVCCWLVVVGCCSLVVRRLLIVVRCWLFYIYIVLFVGCRFLVVVRFCLLCVVCNLWFDGISFLLLGCWMFLVWNVLILLRFVLHSFHGIVVACSLVIVAYRLLFIGVVC